MKAIILARVSTPEQEEAGNSLPAQQARLRVYIERTSGLVLDREFIFDESAYKEHRREFQEVVDYLTSQKEVAALCCDKVDRLTRDFLVGLPALERLRRDGLVQLHFPGDNLVLHKDSPATDLFHFNIAVSLAQYYSNAISDNVKRAYEQKRRVGEWTGKAPIGYKNITIDEKRKDIVFDEERAHHVRRISELYAGGNHSIRKIREQITKEGLVSESGKKLSVSMIEHIIKNPFYYGMARSKGVLYPHKYMPLITKELWDKCQAVANGWGKKPFQYAAKPYVLRGLLRCAKCGCAMSPEMHKGHIYYACTDGKGICKKIYTTEEDLLKPVYEVLKAMERMPQERIDEVVEGLKRSHSAKQVYHGQAIGGLQKEYNEIQVTVDRLLDLLLDGSITKDVHDKKLKKLKERQQTIGILLEEHTDADESYIIAAATVLNLAKRAFALFKSSEVPEKRALLNFLLQNSTVDGKKPYYALRSPFDTILTFAKRPTGLLG